MRSLPKPRVGGNCLIGNGVLLNVRSGRRAVKPIPLQLGHDAHIRSGSVLYAHTRIGNYFETGHHVIIREENIIGDCVKIWNNSTVDYHCRIGNNVKIHCNCYIAQYSLIEDDVFLAPGVILANDLYPGDVRSMRCLRGPTLRHGVQVGVNSTLLPFIEIGAGTLIGAGSVVTRDLPAGVVAWGNPARIHKRVSELPVRRTLSLLSKKCSAT